MQLLKNERFLIQKSYHSSGCHFFANQLNHFLINYKIEPDWDKKVLEITEKRGVDHVVEVGGAGTLQKSLNSVKMGGHIAVIGVVAGKGEFNHLQIFMKSIKVQGIFVGSREMFEEMNKYIYLSFFRILKI